MSAARALSSSASVQQLDVDRPWWETTYYEPQIIPAESLGLEPSRLADLKCPRLFTLDGQSSET